MENKQVRPTIGKEERKELVKAPAEKSKAVSNGANNKNNKNNKEKKREAGKKNMDPKLMKIILSLVGMGCVVAIGLGIYTVTTTRDNTVKEGVISTVADDSDKSDIETTVDINLEAQDSFESSDLPESVRQNYINDYVKYRKQGVEAEKIESMLNERYADANENMSGNGTGTDLEILTEEDEAVLEAAKAEDLAQSEVVGTTEVQEETPAEPEYQVLYLDPCTKYAQTSVNMRTGCGKEYDKIKTLTLNEEVKVIGLAVCEGKSDWYQIGDENGNALGFVMTQYLGDSKVEVKQPTSNNNSTSNSSSNSSSSNNNSTSTESTPAAETPAESQPSNSGSFNTEGFGTGGTYGSSSSIDGNSIGTGGSGDFSGVVLH